MTGAASAITANGTQRPNPRLGPPTRSQRRRSWLWLAFLAICPICVGVVIWAAVSLNGSYPTVKPPVPHGWQAVPGIYSSFSAPRGWSLDQAMSDASGDVYFQGRTGAAGESVTESDHRPSLSAPLSRIVATYVGGHYSRYSVQPYSLKGATVSWLYTFELPTGKRAVAVRAWVKPTLSQIWLIAPADNQLEHRVLQTLAVAH